MGFPRDFAAGFLKFSLLLFSLNACKGSFEWTSELGIASRCATEGACKMLEIDDLPESEFVYAYWGFNQIVLSEDSSSSISYYFEDEADLDRRGEFTILPGIAGQASSYFSGVDKITGEGSANFIFQALLESSSSSSESSVSSDDPVSSVSSSSSSLMMSSSDIQRPSYNVTENSFSSESSELSVSMWIKPSSENRARSTGVSIISSYDDQSQSGWQLSYLNINAQENFLCLIKFVSSSTLAFGCSQLNPLTDNVWQHLAFTFKVGDTVDQAFKIYVNGIDLTDYEYFENPSLLPNATPLELNGIITVGNKLNAYYAFVGRIDDLILWNKKLSRGNVCKAISDQTGQDLNSICPD